ncbi:MAG: hypothetical protein R3F60_05095 [bacterium]
MTSFSISQTVWNHRPRASPVAEDHLGAQPLLEERPWELLSDLLDFADRFVIATVVAADRFPARILRARTEALAGARGWPIETVLCEHPGDLSDALGRILAAPDGSVVWCEAFGPEQDWRTAWFNAAQRWNEHREPLRRSGLHALVVAMPAWARPVVRLAAPDLWSINTLLVEPMVAPVPVSQPDVASPVQRSDEVSPAEVDLAERRARAALALSPEDPTRFDAMVGALAALVRTGRMDRANEVAEALSAWADPVGSYGGLASSRPDADVARALTSLGRDLASLGRREEALSATAEAVGIYRHLASSRPDAFEPDLAGSLNNPGRSPFSSLGRRRRCQRRWRR